MSDVDNEGASRRPTTEDPIPSIDPPSKQISMVESLDSQDSVKEEDLIAEKDNDPAMENDLPAASREEKGFITSTPSAELAEKAVTFTTPATTQMNVYQDHFTLPISSSNVRFRATNNSVRVFAGYTSQFVLEENWDKDDADGKHKVVAKRVSDSTTSLKALRATYTLVCVFFTGFLVVFCIELLLFLVLDVTIEIGATNKGDPNAGRAMGTILALPVYVHGLASCLVIAGHYIGDAWQGHALVNRFTFGRFNGVLTEWISFMVFLGIPLLTMCITLFAGLDNWWELSSLTWFACVAAFYILFAITVAFYENRACLEVMKNRYDDDTDTWPELIRRAVFLRQRRLFSGVRSVHYLAKGSIEEAKSRDVNISQESRRENVSWYSKATQWKFLERAHMFKTYDPPIRTYTIEDAQGVRPYVTANTWSLEKLFCRSYQSRYVAITKGPGSLTKAQLKSSFYCAIIGNTLGIFLLAAALTWLGLPPAGVLLVVVLVVLFALWPGFKQSYHLYQMTKDLLFEISSSSHSQGVKVKDGDDIDNDRDEDEESPTAEVVDDPQANTATVSVAKAPRRNIQVTEEEDCEGLYQCFEYYRITQPTERFCWVMVGVETFFLFFFPAISLFAIQNYIIAVLFVFVGIFSWLRDHLNAALVVEEVGNMDLVDGEGVAKWQAQSRLNEIVMNITRSKGQRAWATVLCVFLLAFMGLFGIAVTQTEDTTSDFKFTYMQDFKYNQEQDLEYPTCTVGKGLESLGSPKALLADYMFLAALAYRDPSITQGELDQWFGAGNAMDMEDFVDDYREDRNVSSAVSFKLIYFNNSKLGVVAVRGTTNAWDALTDAQLWSAAAVFQGLRMLLPIGEMWTPILDRMVNIVSWLQSESIARVAFYKDTTRFINYLKNEEHELDLANVQVTGHSLGGGLSIISGAQTNTAAIALSGPNAMISRKTFDPPLTEEELNTLTFNIIPDRDIVPKLDDRARLFQEIRCTAPVNDFVGCHDGRRSLCEILFACGTQNRPALCDCHTEFGYAKPIPIDNSTGASFDDVCKGLIEESE